MPEDAVIPSMPDDEALLHQAAHEPGTGMPSQKAVVPPTWDTREAIKAMQLESLLANNPIMNGEGVKIGETKHCAS